MGVRNAVDEHMDRVRSGTKEARQNLGQILYTDMWGSDEIPDERRKELKEALDLIEKASEIID